MQWCAGEHTDGRAGKSRVGGEPGRHAVARRVAKYACSVLVDTKCGCCAARAPHLGVHLVHAALQLVGQAVHVHRLLGAVALLVACAGGAHTGPGGAGVFGTLPPWLAWPARLQGPPTTSAADQAEPHGVLASVSAPPAPPREARTRLSADEAELLVLERAVERRQLAQLQLLVLVHLVVLGLRGQGGVVQGVGDWGGGGRVDAGGGAVELLLAAWHSTIAAAAECIAAAKPAQPPGQRGAASSQSWAACRRGDAP